MSGPIVVSSVTVYPVKSSKPIALERSNVEPRGLADDRRWMVVDASGKFVTGRNEPRMVLIEARVDGKTLRLSAPDMSQLTVDDARGNGPQLEVRIWRDDVVARHVDDRADDWLSRYLGGDYRLVYMPADEQRAIDPDFARSGDSVSFADGYPLLLIGDASLADLDARSPIDTEMRRFRPNVTISGSAPFAEDTWQRIRIGEVAFDVPKLCDRCVMTTIDPHTGVADAAREPLRTLAGYRNNRELGILFGVNLIPRSAGSIAVGDEVAVVE